MGEDRFTFLPHHKQSTRRVAEQALDFNGAAGLTLRSITPQRIPSLFRKADLAPEDNPFMVVYDRLKPGLKDI